MNVILTIKDPEVFRALLDGRKRCEGRVWKEKYRSLGPGDLVVFLLEGSTEMAIGRVLEIKEYGSVERMVEELWKDLLPFVKNPEEAKRYYQRFYSLGDPAVAICLEILQGERLEPRTAAKWLQVEVPGSLRVAVAVEGGKIFSGHFGDAPEFYVYECTPEGCSLVERRENRAEAEEEHGEHHGDPRKFRAMLSLLSDVDVWCGFRMGPNFRRILESGRVPFLTGTRDLEEALERVRLGYLGLALRRVCGGDRGR